MIGLKTDKTTASMERALGVKPINFTVVCLLLVVLLVLSALGVIYSSYKSRQLFSESQQLNRESIALEEEWGRLLLEQSTWASHSRVEQVAKEKLHMVVPESSAIIVVQ
jgi:cell division protein FtsL